MCVLNRQRGACERVLESSNLSLVVSVGQCVVIVRAFVVSVYVLLCALQERPLCFNACLG